MVGVGMCVCVLTCMCASAHECGSVCACMCVFQFKSARDVVRALSCTCIGGTSECHSTHATPKTHLQTFQCPAEELR